MVTEELNLSAGQAFIKRGFDFFVAVSAILLLWWLIVIAWVLASLDSRSNGFFVQGRVGKNGKLIHVVKIKTMRPSKEITTTVTSSNDPRITPLGKFFRKTKIDELPQLWNVLTGDMSLVGPRPDVPGFADLLQGEDRAILNIRPGITGPATLKYRNEEEILASVEDPEAYNREVIFPDKVKINLEYIRNWRFSNDIQFLINTVIG